jgi:hypothetical protein
MSRILSASLVVTISVLAPLQRDELAPFHLTLHLLPKPTCKHNRSLSRKGSPQCGISIRLMSARGPNPETIQAARVWFARCRHDCRTPYFLR